MLGLAGLLHAQSDYPSKPVRVIVPFPAGGTSDVMGRMLADELTRVLKQPVIVENIGGAGGVIGIERALKLAPDGYTLIQTGVGQNAVAHGLEPIPKYDSKTNFLHLTQVHHGPNVLVVNSGMRFKSLRDMVDYARSNPGKVDYGYTPAASGHMAMELFKQTAKIALTGIPYRGGGPMMTDILGGQIPMMFINQDVALAHVQSGRLRALAVTSSKRNPLYAEVPTIAESGYPGFEALSWSGVSIAKGTPAPIAEKVETAVMQAMNSANIRKRLESNGFVVPPLGPKIYTEFVAREVDQWTSVIRKAGIKSL
ncbi:MAG TPA: tripartite tricarboxylate transporter substrate binding protein [Burkholderiales bacterium]|nr:tripartite tricarboxylate transporter substrate binding protein [Burkholderiales bacterium]